MRGILNLFVGMVALCLSVSAALAAQGPVLATKVSITLVDGVAVAPNGDIYIARRAHNIISRIDSRGHLTNVVGTGASGFS